MMKASLSRLKIFRDKFKEDKREFFLLFMLLIVLSVVFGIIFYNIWLCGIFFLPFTLRITLRVANELDKRRVNKETEIFQEGTEIIKMSLEAGYSCENSLAEAACKLTKTYPKSEVANEFREAVGRLKRNESLEKVLNRMGDRIKTENCKSFFEVFATAYNYGGNVVEVISETTEHMKMKNDIQKDIETILSGKRFEQRIMCVMPFVMIIYLRLTSDFIDSLYGNAFGAAIMTVAAIIYMVSVIFSEKIIDIKV